MKKWALITGASGGIGLEIARVLAEKGYALVLTARGEDALERLAQALEGKHGAHCLTVALDLGVPGGVDALVRFVAEAGVQPSVLVNNAGMGVYGRFADVDPERIQAMVDLNVGALTRLTALLLPAMLKHGGGRILNVASTAAFQPGPGMAVYFASKAYVLSLSEALDVELRPLGVTVTVLCPGATDTGFMSSARAQHSALFKGRLAKARDVAQYGVAAMERGQRVAIHGKLNRIMAVGVRFTPRRLAAAMAGWMVREV